MEFLPEIIIYFLSIFGSIVLLGKTSCFIGIALTSSINVDLLLLNLLVRGISELNKIILFLPLEVCWWQIVIDLPVSGFNA